MIEQDAVDRTEKQCIEDALTQARRNRTEAAKILGISRKTLFNKMLQLGIKTGERLCPGERRENSLPAHDHRGGGCCARRCPVPCDPDARWKNKPS